MDLRESMSNQTTVDLKITKHVLSKADFIDKNIVFSPSSITVLLSLIAAGSSGPTLDELLSFLNCKSGDLLRSFASELLSVIFADGSPSGGPRLSFANGVWLDMSLSLNPYFKQVVDAAYKAHLAQADFQAKAAEATHQVNLWIANKTGGLINEILPPNSVDATTRLILANALYFKGNWSEKFDTLQTKEYDFHLINGSSVKVPFMTSKKKQAVRAFDGFKTLRLPYKQGADKRNFSMYVFLPDAKDGLSALIQDLGSGPGFVEKHLPYDQVEVGDFRIPKFKISSGFEASEVMKDLGLLLPFSGGGLTQMVEYSLDQELFVSHIFHKSFIEVNEEGTEASAASAAVVRYRALFSAEKMDFIADHPFLFFIREDMTGLLLFVGQVLNPNAN